MKTTFYVIAMIAFSALMLSPKEPKDYPPKIVVDQRKEIVCKEAKILGIINTLERNHQVDSIQIQKLK